MIFIGAGSHVSRAARYALARGHAVDLCLVEDESTRRACVKMGIPALQGRDVDGEVEMLREACSDGIVFSLNNSRLLSAELLVTPGLTFYGVHTGIIPIQKGNPVVCAIFAILEGHAEYGVSLFRLDAGIDTGDVVAIEKFSLTDDTTLADVFMAAFPLCQRIFETNLDRLMQGEPAFLSLDGTSGRTYLLKNLEEELSPYCDDPNLGRALEFGRFAAHMAREKRAVEAVLGARS